MTSCQSNLKNFQDYLENDLLTNIYPPPNSSNSLRSRCKKPRNYTPHQTNFHTGPHENLPWPSSALGIIKGRHNDSTFKGIGILVGPNIVFTKGRNLHHFANKISLDIGTLRFKPGIYAKSLPFGEKEVERYFIFPSYLKEEKDAFAILILKKPIGDLTGYFGIACLTTSELATKRIGIIGHRNEQPNSIWEVEGSVLEINQEENYISYDIDTAENRSGGVIFYQENGRYFVCGVQEKEGSRETLFTPKIYEEIYEWIQGNVKKEQLLYLKKNQGDFGGYRMDAECVALLLKYNFESIGSLDFRLERIQVEGAKLLAENFSGEKLSHLYLAENMIGEEGAKALGNNTSWKNLVKLDLTGNNIGDEGIKALARNTSWVRLSELYLRHNNIGDSGAEALAQNNYWVNLSRLSLSENNVGDKGALLLAKNASWENLSELGLNWNKIRDKGAQALARNESWVKLARLELFKNNIGDEGAKGLAQNSSWSNLSTLDLSENKIGDKGAKGLGENSSWTKLARLYLSENRIGDEGGEALGKNESWRELKHLHLTFNRIGDKGAEGLGGNSSWIKLLRLYLSENNIEDNGTKALAKNSSWRKIEEMDLANNKIGDEGTTALAENSSWVSLLQLDLSQNKIGDQGALAIAKNKTWKNLAQLILNFNKIGDAGVVSLASRKISQLQLSWNPITLEGTRILLAMPDFYWIPSEGNIAQVFSIWNAVENFKRFGAIKMNLQEIFQLFHEKKISAKQFKRFIQENWYVVNASFDLNITKKEDRESVEEVTTPLCIASGSLFEREDVGRQEQIYSDLNPNSYSSFGSDGWEFPLENVYMNTQSPQETDSSE